MKIMFTVQGEGRGHMTQAIAAYEMLRRRGCELTAVLAGGEPSRNLPPFFERAFDVPVRRIASPAFVQSKNRGIAPLRSCARLLKNMGVYRASLAAIDDSIRAFQPDLIVNFLEPLMGVYNARHRPSVPTLAVGHQFMIEHPDFLRVREFPLQRIGLRNYIRLTGARSFKLALSFYPAANQARQRLTTCPPILRPQLFGLTPVAGERLLVYLVFHGFKPDIMAWSDAHPGIPIDCFYDKPDAPIEERANAFLTFHRLDGEKFLKLMAGCRAVVCTAGFESVSEAAYLGKPVMMVPVENHLEQLINAKDAESAGLGIRDRRFDLSRLLGRSPSLPTERFKAWVDSAEEILYRAVLAAVGRVDERPARKKGESRMCAPEAVAPRAAAVLRN